jgi:hypothetical protein
VDTTLNAGETLDVRGAARRPWKLVKEGRSILWAVGLISPASWVTFVTAWFTSLRSGVKITSCGISDVAMRVPFHVEYWSEKPERTTSWLFVIKTQLKPQYKLHLQVRALYKASRNATA